MPRSTMANWTTRSGTTPGGATPEGTAPARRGRVGFTLIELVLALALLVIVLSTAYSIIVDSLQADQNLDRLTVPEKVGEGLLSLVRRDLGGTFFRNMGTRVFQVEDGGAVPDARDELRFISTVEPTPIDTSGTGDPFRLRTMTGIVYFLRPSQLAGGLEGYTLFRKEIVEFDPMEPLASPGVNYELYSHVRYFSIECFDGWGWFENWDSEARILEEQDAALEGVDEDTGIARVSDPTATPGALASAPGVATDQPGGMSLLPVAAVPVAVRVELGIYSMSRGKPLRDPNGDPIIKKYSTIVPILSAQRVPLQMDDGTGGLEGEGGAAGDGNTAGVENPSGLTLPGGAGGRGPGGRVGAGGRGASGRFGGGGRFGAGRSSGREPTRAGRLQPGGPGGGGGRPR